MKWSLLILAILFEVTGTAMMKLSEGFTKPVTIQPKK
jgi:multidrug transporter EmrE-like cation transporter